MNRIRFGKTSQDPNRVIAAIERPELSLVAAITVHDGHELKSAAIDIATEHWPSLFEVTFPDDLMAHITRAELFDTGRDQVLMHMCSEGMDSCHVVILNGRSRYDCDDHVHSNRLVVVRQVAEQRWATALSPLQRFWFIASVISRFSELCIDPKLDWASKELSGIGRGLILI